MRLTLRRRIIIGLAVIVAIGVASMLIVRTGLVRLQRTMHVLADVEAPTVGAAYEMEINVLGYGMAVLRYLDGRRPEDRARATKDEADFRRFHAEYARLAKTNRAREFAQRLDTDLVEFKRQGEDLMARRDRDAMLFASAMGNLERIDEIIDRQLQPRINRADTRDLRKLEAILDMEAELAEYGLWLANYRRTRLPEHLKRAGQKKAEFDTALAILKRDTAIGSIGGRTLEELQRVFADSVAALGQAQGMQDGLVRDQEKFWALREKIDALLDDEVQVATLNDFAAPRIAADRAVVAIVGVATILVPLFVLLATAVGFVLIRRVMRPVERLTHATNAIRQGDLHYRVDSDGDDELTDLGREFNRMVAQLEDTTVSKAVLEVSEGQLRKANLALKQEIEERHRAEEALSRSELLTAMGSLVAGVAHEVRNPLFGMSSTVDALHARLRRGDADAPYAEHVRVLRAELERLRKLMQDLLDYGKPSVMELADNSVSEVVAAAVRGCEAFAARRQVTITTRIQPGAEACAFDRTRIEQVIRNLLENAIQHSPPTGTVWLTAHPTTRDALPCLCLRVRDEGPGFEPAQLPRVFEPFVTRRSGGTGLGLSIVERIVDAHGGTVHAVNKPGGGAELTVELPLNLTRIPGEEVAHAQSPRCR